MPGLRFVQRYAETLLLYEHTCLWNVYVDPLRIAIRADKLLLKFYPLGDVLYTKYVL